MGQDRVNVVVPGAAIGHGLAHRKLSCWSVSEEVTRPIRWRDRGLPVAEKLRLLKTQRINRINNGNDGAPQVWLKASSVKTAQGSLDDWRGWWVGRMVRKPVHITRASGESLLLSQTTMVAWLRCSATVAAVKQGSGWWLVRQDTGVWSPEQ